ncbi:hypothetical protein ACIRL0_36310 [Streptomyces sp. NPDC102365]|uniref:hypothetical protein n=1 Tax=Streptomyces sp. NPDC102365 TaxID=3366162 RepID=UPI003820BDB3
MAGRLTRACTSLRVPAAELLDALCALAERPAPPFGPHPVRHVHGQVLEAVGSLPWDVLQPGDVSAAMDVRAGLLNAEVPAQAEAAALCIRRTVDDLGPAELWELARGTAVTRGDLMRGAAATLAGGRPVNGDLLDELAAHTLAEEVTERSPCQWGRQHADAVRAALYRSLADLADALLEVSESTPTPLDWTGDGTGTGGRSATAVIGPVTYGVLVQPTETATSATEPVWHHPSLCATHAAWQWRIASGPHDPASHGCGTFPSAPAARHAAECAITALAAGRCDL